MADSGNDSSADRNVPGEDPESDGDAELAALLSSALNDFDKQKAVRQRPATNGPAPALSSSGKVKKNEPKGKKAEPPFDPSMMREVDDIFKNMMSQDPQLKEHWEKLAESCSRAGQFLCPDVCPFI